MHIRRRPAGLLGGFRWLHGCKLGVLLRGWLSVVDTDKGVVMKVLVLWVAAIALCLAACSKQEPTEPQQPESESAAAAAEEAAAPKAEFDQAFVDHMHAHAEQLDDLMFALADGDLAGAMTPAYWLARHETVAGVPGKWQQYVYGMREAARAVEAATDLEAARAAAEELSGQCQACHVAAGVGEVQ